MLNSGERPVPQQSSIAKKNLYDVAKLCSTMLDDVGTV